MELKIENEINNTINNDIEKEQIKFIETDLGKVINVGIDIGIKALLPDLIEDQIIEIKDAILESGFKDGIKQVIDSSIEFGKSVAGIFTGKFENITQVQNAVKSGGILDGISDLLSESINYAKQKGVINSSVASMLRQGKNTIIKSIGSKIEESLTEQLKAVEKLESYCGKWNTHYEDKDFSKMETAYNNIEKYLEKVIPFENTINEARRIENIHNLIKNNGKDFSLSEEELKLAEML